jgi:bifunctional UDP-N-acetylglucosamine pyrophosphorylase/glucosamine-1-phosphate N-acetyltransferase
MLTFGGRPILDNTLRMLKECGINNVNMVVGHNADVITGYFQGGEEYDVNLHYIRQTRPGKIGEAVWLARDRFTEGGFFLLVYGDVLTSKNIIAPTLQSFAISKAPTASICLTTSSKLLGNVYLDETMRIVKVVEKPKKGELGNYVLSGVFVLPVRFFDLLKKSRMQMESALVRLIREEEGIRASIWEDDWIDIAYPWDILRANEMIMNTWHTASIADTVVMKDVQIKGPVHIEENVEIESGTVIEGPCFIGSGSFIGNSVLVRKYTSVGRKSVIGYGVELKNSVLFDGARIGRLSYVGDSVVGGNVDIGSGTMTINGNLDRSTVFAAVNGKRMDTGLTKLGAFIGDGSVIGASNTLQAGSVVHANAKIPHNHSYPVKGKGTARKKR